MKILIINTEKNRGGAARMAASLVNFVNQHKSDVQAVLVHCGDNSFSETFRGWRV